MKRRSPENPRNGFAGEIKTQQTPKLVSKMTAIQEAQLLVRAKASRIKKLIGADRRDVSECPPAEDGRNERLIG